jgi:hypothetical protein
MTPVTELDFQHTVRLKGVNVSIHAGMTVRGTLKAGGTYCAEVEFSTPQDAIVLVTSATSDCAFQRGSRIRYLFQ